MECYEERKNCFHLAAAYVPYQELGRLFPLDEGLDKGTIFPELYKPYYEECKR